MINNNFLDEVRSVVIEDRDFAENVKMVFELYECNYIYEHSTRVANKAEELAIIFHADKESAYKAGIVT